MEAADDAAGDDGKGDLFGRMYTYQELLSIQPPEKERKQMERPAHWPADTEVDPGKWVAWLPEGWSQGIKTTSTGNRLKVYMTPEGKRFFHKVAIEQALGRKLASKEAPPEDEPKECPSVHEAIPKWPEGDWLPKDWRLAFRKLPSRLHRIFIPPNQEEGFLYHRTDVEMYLAGNKTSVSLFGTSMPMAEISANAASGDPSLKKSRHKKKHHHHRHRSKSSGPQAKVVEETDFAEDCSLVVVPLPAGSAEEKDLSKCLVAVGALDVEVFAERARQVREALLKRQFDPQTSLVAVLTRGGADIGSPSQVLRHLVGLYYERSDAYGGRPCYQQVRPSTRGHGDLACGRFHLFWSERRSCWKIGVLDDGMAGFARCSDDQQSAAGLQGKTWSVLTDSSATAKGSAASPVASTPTSTDAAPAPPAAQSTDATSLEDLFKETNASARNSAATPPAETPASAEATPAPAEAPAQASDSPSVDATTTLTASAAPSDITPIAALVESPSLATAASPSPPAKENSSETLDGEPATASATEAAATSEEPGQEADGDDDELHTIKVWTWPEIEHCKIRSGEGMTEPPIHWPPGIDVFAGRWADWLPEDWGQGVKRTANTTRTVYIHPDGRVANTPQLVCKILGRELDMTPKYTNIPQWPEWLPKDWGISNKQSNGSKKAIFVAPGFQRYFWNRSAVDVHARRPNNAAPMKRGGKALGLLRLSDADRRVLEEWAAKGASKASGDKGV
eukprot:TRINITY_DN55098_c0_g1_i1.p1 TRINITY_DN55098_c0_g1~~TRINITY_DN55098_c0_g1_i1.p1  ORF type:complete len:755 (-),score=156.71 TRINITY_DN55098_c0_g1_i1:63-2267(-)